MKPEANFKNKVYAIIRKIPKGKVLTYKKVAQLAGRPKAFRAVGNALNKNRNPKIPCHRVIRSDGRVGRYSGPYATRYTERRTAHYNRGTAKKTLLLKKEGVVVKNRRIFT